MKMKDWIWDCIVALHDRYTYGNWGRMVKCAACGKEFKRYEEDPHDRKLTCSMGCALKMFND